MKKIKYITILLLTAGFCRAQEESVHFKGTIYNEKNAVLQGALVQVTQNAFLFNALTANAQGEYKIDLPLEGEYDVTISKPGYVQKKYFVSTKGITKEKLMKLPVYTADVVLFNFYEGVDYSLFEGPINKYQYSLDNNNINYDEKYLKEMRVAMREVKKQEREVLRQRHEKEMEASKIAHQGKVGYIPRKAVALNTPVFEVPKTEEIIETNTVIIKNTTDARTLAFLSRYQPGVTEEIIQGENVYIIQRVLVQESSVWIYQKKIFNWGGIACFRDNASITEGIFEQETKANSYNNLNVKEQMISSK